MSSFGKNIIPRRAHKERAQPASRVSKHGLLEKKKDYKLRARDRNRKALRVKLLKEKAAFRNPDEFYYGMIRSATDAGRVRKGINVAERDALPIEHRDREQRLLAETQDAGYVRVKTALEKGKIEKMKKGLHFVQTAQTTKRQHVVFVDDEEELQQLEKELGNRGAADGHGKLNVQGPNRNTRKLLRKSHDRVYRELEQRERRHEKLKTVFSDMATEKVLLSKGTRVLERRADPVTGAPPVYRWQQERKR